ncbi:hypothetical protein Tco_0711531 [Tanacetum coccineum]
MLLGKPFLATIHAHIDVFRREILLGIGEEEVTFDMNGGICHSRVPFEIFYMASSVQESEYFNPLEIETDAFFYDSLACLLFEKSTHPRSDESIGTVDSSDDMQELEGSQEDEVGSHPLENVVSRWHVCKPVLDMMLFMDKRKVGCSSNGYVFKIIKDNIVRGYGIDIADFLKLENEYELKAGRKRYALDEVWEKCEKFHDTTKLWYDKGFEEEELWQNGIEEIDYTPLLVKSETFEVHRYTFKNRKSFISITKQMDDFLTLGRVNRSRFMEKTRKEMDEGMRTTRKT